MRSTSPYSRASKSLLPRQKLVPGNELFELITHLLRERFSPEQIAGKLSAMKMNFEEAYVCRETIYNAIYALPVGELRKELIRCLRQGKSTRRPRSGGVDRRGQIPDMVSIHMRPPEIGVVSRNPRNFRHGREASTGAD